MDCIDKSVETLEIDLIGNLSVGVVCVDESLDVLYLNAAAEAVLKVSSNKARGRNLLDFTELPDSLLAHMHETLQSGQPFNDREVNLAPAGGSPLLVDCTISPWTQRKQNVGLVIELTAIDRQVRIAREEALSTQQQGTTSLLRSLAHEIKNPLGGLRGAAQLLENELDDNALREYTKIIIRESDRLRQLIDRMLGPASALEMKMLNIHEVLEHVRKIIGVEAPSGIELAFDYDPSIPELLSDHDRLVQVFLNIAGNALNAVGTSGKIIFRSRVISNLTIGTTRHPLVVGVEIIDDGKGITEELREQIFFPLVSGSADGTGLGLSIAQTTIHQLGGLIECTSEPKRTTFTVLIPIATKISTAD